MAECLCNFRWEAVADATVHAVGFGSHLGIVRRCGLDYEGWRYVSKQVRKVCSLKPAKKGRRLPNVLTGDDFPRFFEVLDRSDDIQHSLMIRLLFFTGMRVSELCNTQVSDVDLEACRIRVNQSKGGKDRTVLFGKSFAIILRTHIAGHSDNRWLFQTRQTPAIRRGESSRSWPRTRRRRGVKATPHTFRHQAITWLTRHSGMADAELQLLTGHSKRETLAIYQHIALDGELEAKYQQALSLIGRSPTGRRLRKCHWPSYSLRCRRSR
ncbi:MAG: tyrosine-type recombinase/integrase [Pirellulales bacterium]